MWGMSSEVWLEYPSIHWWLQQREGRPPWCLVKPRWTKSRQTSPSPWDREIAFSQSWRRFAIFGTGSWQFFSLITATQCGSTFPAIQRRWQFSPVEYVQSTSKCCAAAISQQSILQHKARPAKTWPRRLCSDMPWICLRGKSSKVEIMSPLNRNTAWAMIIVFPCRMIYWL